MLKLSIRWECSGVLGFTMSVMASKSEPASGSGQTPAAAGAASAWVWAALVVALAGLAGSLWLSLAMNFKACALCFY
jgi:hypothetical protein